MQTAVAQLQGPAQAAGELGRMGHHDERDPDLAVQLDQQLAQRRGGDRK